jgi:hypothetical protein
MEEQREESILRVEDAMQAPTGVVLSSEETVHQANLRTQGSNMDTFLVRLSPSGWSSVTRELLATFDREGKGDQSLGSALPTARLPYLHPDYPLEMALRYVYQTALVPVVSRADFRQLEGLISSEAVLNKYKVVSREQD